jgi:hypothetical protein
MMIMVENPSKKEDGVLNIIEPHLKAELTPALHVCNVVNVECNWRVVIAHVTLSSIIWNI